METCPTCGRETRETPRSNASSAVMLPVPEGMIPVLNGILRQASLRAGMHGYGIVANMLADFGEPLREALPWFMKGFEPEAWAQALYAHDLGHEIVVLPDPDPERRKIHVVGFERREGEEDKARGLASRHYREDEEPDSIVAALEDFFLRREPVPQRTKEAEPEDPGSA